MTCCDLEIDKNGNHLCPTCGHRLGMYHLDGTLMSSGTIVPSGLTMPTVDHYHSCTKCGWHQDNNVISR